MPSLRELAAVLRQLDSRGYRSYGRIAGSWDGDGFQLVIDHVQGDPFADPSRVRALLPAVSAALPAWTRSSAARITATADFLNRRLYDACARIATPRGSGRSGEIHVLRPGQQVLDRTSVLVNSDGDVEARFRVGLPARGRSIAGDEAALLLTEDVPAAIEAALRFTALDADALRLHVETVEDARALRAQLREHGLVAFVADDANLPRASGADDAPLDSADTVPFRAPAPLRVTLHAPNGGAVTGLGVRRGVTLIAGGGFHGKSTLLRALERGVYDHVPGDGRERVVTDAAAVRIQAEDGRAVAGVDISNFIGAIPGSADTRAFTTTNASGSTSQAAAIVEALEAGATALLLDEDTSATNFMIRDARMQSLVADADEPITPLIDRARDLADRCGVSLVMVVGGSGDYFDVADTVLSMRGYVPHDVTAAAKRIAQDQPTLRRPLARAWAPLRQRTPLPESIDPSRGRRLIEVKVFGATRARFGTQEVDVSGGAQLVEAAQLRAVALSIAHARGNEIDGRTTMSAVLHAIMHDLERRGLDEFQRHPTGELAAFRIFELAAFLNRLRGLACHTA